MEIATQTVVVTGVAGRLGTVVAEMLKSRGAAVVGLDVAKGSGVLDAMVEADLTSEEAVDVAFQTVRREVGGFSALIHTVGAWGGSPLAETSEQAFTDLIRVNLTSAFLCFREAVKVWREDDTGGCLVAIASMQGADRGAAEQAGYSAAKAGVVRLVEATAAEHHGNGIVAAAVAPSMILFGGEPPDLDGVRAADVARTCVYLAAGGAAVHNGSVIRAYGSMR